MKKILIANRGEIACRIIRSVKDMGYIAVAVYSDADIHAKHVRLADEAYHLGGAAAKDSYLDISNIIKVCIDNQVSMIHPGYGFLSENAEFAIAIAKAGLTFIGPP